MFEDMNFKDKDIELFVNAITEILEFPDDIINEANIEEIEKAMIAGLSGADREQAVKETVIKMKVQGYTKEKVEEMITEYENSLKDVMDEVANYTSNPYKIRIINKVFELLGEIINEAIEKFFGYDTIIYFELVHPNAKIPTYAHDTDAGADVYAPMDVVIPPQARGLKVDTGFKMAMTPGWYMAVCPRSGLSYKTTMRIANTPGTVDCDYRDNVGILIDNLSDETLTIKAGDRIAQFILHPVYRFKGVTVEDVNKIGENRGGGFGSTGE